jgi:hypothetical protein
MSVRIKEIILTDNGTPLNGSETEIGDECLTAIGFETACSANRIVYQPTEPKDKYLVIKDRHCRPGWFKADRRK